MNSAPLRVVVVEDSLTIRKYLIDVLDADPGLSVVGEASDGKTAIDLCGRLRPNVITMDMMLPVMTGLAATEYIMAHHPTPILIVSASTNRGELFKTYDALAAGAVDVLDKPKGFGSEDWEKRLLAAVRMAARIRVITHPRARLGALNGPRVPPPDLPPASAPEKPRLVAIGTSTGGPGALLTILGSLPKHFPLPVLVVLHISEPFGQAMADWLDSQLPFEVRYARDGERLPARGAACVLMAPPDQHLELSAGRLHLSRGPERHSCRPSVDVLFESIAREAAGTTIACLLTGMGRDGASGLLQIKESGGLTLAQDQSSSIVFGMPHEAIQLGAANHVLPLSEFAPFLAKVSARTSKT